MVPYSENPDFVGREEVLEELKGRLGPSHDDSQGGVQHRLAVWGLGGIG